MGASTTTQFASSPRISTRKWRYWSTSATTWVSICSRYVQPSTRSPSQAVLVAAADIVYLHSSVALSYTCDYFMLFFTACYLSLFGSLLCSCNNCYGMPSLPVLNSIYYLPTLVEGSKIVIFCFVTISCGVDRRVRTWRLASRMIWVDYRSCAPGFEHAAPSYYISATEHYRYGELLHATT